MEPQNHKTQKKATNSLFVMSIQDEDGVIVKVLSNSDYDQLWLIGTAESKSMRGFWTIHDIQGRFIDGNFKVKTNK